MALFNYLITLAISTSSGTSSKTKDETNISEGPFSFNQEIRDEKILKQEPSDTLPNGAMVYIPGNSKSSCLPKTLQETDLFESF